MVEHLDNHSETILYQVDYDILRLFLTWTFWEINKPVLNYLKTNYLKRDHLHYNLSAWRISSVK